MNDKQKSQKAYKTAMECRLLATNGTFGLRTGNGLQHVILFLPRPFNPLHPRQVQRLFIYDDETNVKRIPANLHSGDINMNLSRS